MQITITNHPHFKFRVINHDELRFAFYIKNCLNLFRRLKKSIQSNNTSLRLGGRHSLIILTLRKLETSIQQIKHQI